MLVPFLVLVCFSNSSDQYQKFNSLLRSSQKWPLSGIEPATIFSPGFCLRIAAIPSGNTGVSSSLPSIKDNLIKILYFINIGIFIYLNHSNKSARGLFNGVSWRRSRYIGVLRNRSKWQVLLNEGKVKKYIGTYPTEKEAAIVNDFYSIGINGLAAKTNFSYNSSQIAWMITSYFSNNMQFDPSIFASQIY